MQGSPHPAGSSFATRTSTTCRATPTALTRHGGGGIKDLGNYSCTVEGCGWSITSAKKCQAYDREERPHRSRVTTTRTEKVVRRRKTDGEIKATRQERDRRKRERGKEVRRAVREDTVQYFTQRTETGQLPSRPFDFYFQF